MIRWVDFHFDRMFILTGSKIKYRSCKIAITTILTALHHAESASVLFINQMHRCLHLNHLIKMYPGDLL